MTSTPHTRRNLAAHHSHSQASSGVHLRLNVRLLPLQVGGVEPTAALWGGRGVAYRCAVNCLMRGPRK